LPRARKDRVGRMSDRPLLIDAVGPELVLLVARHGVESGGWMVVW
jgi:hypothetical protein